jgi:ribosome biogenesis GTPase / thiamine phosphate phosphatase
MAAVEDASPLEPYGWSPRWRALLGEVEDATGAGRVVRHDGAGVVVATTDGIASVLFGRRLDPSPVVGDWVALGRDGVIAVLPRTSLLRRRAAMGESEQPLAANVDVVFLVCGLDRPLKAGRVQRGAALAWDAGAEPVVVLTKAAVAADVDAAVAVVHEATPGLDVLVTSVKEGVGLDRLREVAAGRTATLLGESGAGKSSIVNALLGTDAARTGAVRAGDSKGRHTTTARELHLLPGGGVLVDTPGIRAIGLWIDPDAVATTFADVADLAAQCRFADCGHRGEPGCAIAAAIADGTLDADRVEAWRRLEAEAESAALRAVPHEQRRRDKRFSRVTKDAQKRKGR